MMDESNDRGDDKMLVILARTYDCKMEKAVTRLIDMPVCNVGTAAHIFETVDAVLR